MKKTVQQEEQSGIQLRRVIGVGTAILLVAGNIIGTGVFKKIVPMAATGLSESYILLAWLLAGLIALFGAFTIAGLAKSTTVSGGLYEYMRQAFGKFPGFLLGWTCFSISLSGSLAAVAFIFAQSVNTLIPLPNPLQQWSHISFWNFINPFDSSGIKILAIATIALMTWFNCRGIKNGSVLNNFVTSLKIIGILFLIVLGLFFSSTDAATVSTSTGAVQLKETGILTALFAAVLSAFWAYDGFTNITYLTGEIKNPKRNLPIAIISGVCLVIFLYLLTNFAYLNAVPAQELGVLGDNKIAASYIAGNVMGHTGSILISVLLMLSSFGALNVMIIVYARLYFRMAQENMFFRSAAKVHPVFRTPYISLIYSMAWSMILVLSGTFDKLTDMVIFVSFILYAILAVGLIKLKRKKIISDKVIGYPWAPVIFIFFALVIAVNTFITQPKLSIIGIGLVATGIPFYFYFKWKYKGLPVVKDEKEVDG